MTREPPTPSLAHRILRALVPQRWFDAIEADSRKWLVRCSRCDFTQSVWAMGGIRYKARGRPRWFLKCSKCGKRSWHHVSRDQASG
ncbi:MAG: hypothetical protein SGI72_01280 [Planctomycetota bacterium]|nr:hypothetical protein [Planctomycetota bacterium]